MLLHDSAAVRLHGSLYSAAAAPRCGLVHVLACGAGAELGRKRLLCCGSVLKVHIQLTRKSIVVIGSFTLTSFQKEEEEKECH